MNHTRTLDSSYCTSSFLVFYSLLYTCNYNLHTTEQEWVKGGDGDWGLTAFSLRQLIEFQDKRIQLGSPAPSVCVCVQVLPLFTCIVCVLLSLLLSFALWCLPCAARKNVQQACCICSHAKVSRKVDSFIGRRHQRSLWLGPISMRIY